MSTVLSQVTDIITILIFLVPIGVQMFSLIAQKSHNQKLINLSERAQIIVRALDQSSLTSEQKKAQATAKLAKYASEVGIKVTADQLDDYIESAVKLVKTLTQ